MIISKVYKINYEEEVALVDRVIRTNIEDAFGVFDDEIINSIANTAEPGWITDEGDFLSGEEALNHAEECDQLTELAIKTVKKNNIKALQKSFLKKS